VTNQETHRPPLLLIKGDATDEEVAAVVAVLQAATGSPAPPAPAPNAWAEARRGLRTTPPPGPGAWRASALPR
jgi:hypothetical protein